jgi:hypothetical protein
MLNFTLQGSYFLYILYSAIESGSQLQAVLNCKRFSIASGSQLQAVLNCKRFSIASGSQLQAVLN